MRVFRIGCERGEVMRSALAYDDGSWAMMFVHSGPALTRRGVVYYYRCKMAGYTLLHH